MSAKLTGEPGGNGRHVFSLAAGNGRGTIRRTTGNFVDPHLALESIRQPNDHHSMMEQGSMKTEYGRFLAAMLGRGAGEHTADFSHKLPFRPQLPGGVEELAHLTAHIPEPGRGLEDNSISLG